VQAFDPGKNPEIAARPANSAMSSIGALETAQQLCQQLGIEYLPLDWLKFSGDSLRVINSSFHIGTAAQVSDPPQSLCLELLVIIISTGHNWTGRPFSGILSLSD
jgi:hypothetical protein